MKIDAFVCVFHLVLNYKCYATDSTLSRIGQLFRDEEVKGTIKNIADDRKNKIRGNNIDNQYVDDSLDLFYRDEQASKENDVDEVVMAMTDAYEDMKNILEARDAKNNEDIEDALYSFRTNLRTLKEKGVDEAVINDFATDIELDVILNHTQIRGPLFEDEETVSVQTLGVKNTDATFTTSGLSLTIKKDGSVELVRTDVNRVISNSHSTGWSIYNRYENSHTPLDNMVRIGSNEIELSGKNGMYKVNVLIKGYKRYFKFELIHVSNNPTTGELDGNWPGNRVMFDTKGYNQGDQWKINTLLLNPMSELLHRSPYVNGNGIHFNWPYPQWAQTDDRPQPQGAVAAFVYRDDTEHDDILKDIWVAENSLPRPNRKNHLTSWTRDDIDAWLNRFHEEVGKPFLTLDCDPQGVYENLFTAADVAHKGGMNAIYLHQNVWQYKHIGHLNKSLFPNGPEDAIAWKKYCDERGLSIHLRGFAGPIKFDDPLYGRDVIHDELATSAEGILLEDVPAEALGYTFTVKPDLDYMPGMKVGMLPFYDVRTIPNIKVSNGGLGAHYPPYYEQLSSRISLDKNVYKYTATLVSGNKWKIVLGNHGRDRVSLTPLVDHKRLSRVKFILMSSNGKYFVQDSRSNLLVEQAEAYAKILNIFQSTGTGYDGAPMNDDLGSWGLRRFTQEIYERLDHPVSTVSSYGMYPFGHFDYQFKSVREATKQSSAVPFYCTKLSALAPGLDAANQGAGKGAQSQNINIRSLHSGLTMAAVEDHGLFNDFAKLLRMWTKIKSKLSPEEAKMIADTKDDFFSVKDDKGKWTLSKTRAMRRPGIDGNWNTQPERPDIAPRQYLCANDRVLNNLYNPYKKQTPVVELHVMADMRHNHNNNLSLMPEKKNQVINPKGAEQKLVFTNGKLKISVDNSKSAEDYGYITRDNTVGHWLLPTNMANCRGVAITVEGDKSGSTLVLSTGGLPRMYVVDIDFVGTRTIAIPNGEVCNNRDGWSTWGSGTVTQFDYSHVDTFRLFLHKVPAKTKSVVSVTKIVAMHENQDIGLKNPILTLNNKKIKVKGTIPYNHYLVYSGGKKAKVYDADWNMLKKTLKVSGSVKKFKAITGSNNFKVKGKDGNFLWLSSRIKVKDTQNPIVIKK